jgi:hypothetical protein
MLLSSDNLIFLRTTLPNSAFRLLMLTAITELLLALLLSQGGIQRELTL